MAEGTEVPAPGWAVEGLDRTLLDGVLDGPGAPSGERAPVDLAVLPFFADERPLQGLAGLVDWRGCGRLSSYLRRGLVVGEAGEQLLTLGGPGQPAARFVLVGLGPRADFDAEGARVLGPRLVATAAGLGSASVLVAMPEGLERELAELVFASLVDAVRATERAGTVETREAGPEPDPAPDPAREDASAVGSPAEGIAGADGGSAQAEATRGAVPELPAEAADPVELPRDRTVSTEGQDDARGPHPAHGAPPRDDAGTEDPALGHAELGHDDATPAAGEGPEEDAEPARTREAAAVEASEASPREAPPPRAGEMGSDAPSPISPGPSPRWWVVAEARLAGRLRRILSGPPRPAAET